MLVPSVCSSPVASRVDQLNDQDALGVVVQNRGDTSYVEVGKRLKEEVNFESIGIKITTE